MPDSKDNPATDTSDLNAETYEAWVASQPCPSTVFAVDSTTVNPMPIVPLADCVATVPTFTGVVSYKGQVIPPPDNDGPTFAGIVDYNDPTASVPAAHAEMNAVVRCPDGTSTTIGRLNDLSVTFKGNLSSSSPKPAEKVGRGFTATDGYIDVDSSYCREAYVKIQEDFDKRQAVVENIEITRASIQSFDVVAQMKKEATELLKEVESWSQALERHETNTIKSDGWLDSTYRKEVLGKIQEDFDKRQAVLEKLRRYLSN